MKSVRRVVLLHPFQFPFALCALLIAVVFTVFPQALEHSPVSFETRGIVHHVWHYALLAGGAFTVAGLFLPEGRGVSVELVGLTLLAAAVALNLTALVAGEITETGENPLGGFGAALRVAALLGIAARMYIISTNATVEIPTSGNDA